MDRSIDKGNDFWTGFYCCMCAKATPKRETFAEKHCADCGKNFCTNCLIQHNTYLPGHVTSLTDDLQAPSNKPKPPTQQCRKHAGKLIDQYCEAHDVTCCSACMFDDHGSCRDKIRYIPNIAEGFKETREIKDLEHKVKALQTRLNERLKRSQANLQQLKKDKDDILKEVRVLRKDLNTQLDKMENDLLREADAEFNAKVKKIGDTIGEIDACLVKIGQRLKHLQSAKDDNEAELFVACKLWKQELKDGRRTTDVETRPLERSLKLTLPAAISGIKDGIQKLAMLQEKTPEMKVSQKTETNILLTDDNLTADITDLCQLQNDLVIMADYSNKRLKTLHQDSMKVSKLIDLADNPFSVCAVDNTTVAVSLINTRQVQFITVGRPVSVESSIRVGDRCRGVAYRNGELYVCCGGSTHRSDEGPGRVHVYNRRGQLLRCFQDKITCPSTIKLFPDMADPYMVIQNGDIQLFGSRDGSYSGTYSHSQYGVQRPFCVVGNDYICISDNSTGDLHLHSRDMTNGTGGKLLYSINDEDICVQAMLHDRKYSRLYLAASDYNMILFLSVTEL